MGRQVKRVALDFDWPMNTVWPGYCVGPYHNQSAKQTLDDAALDKWGDWFYERQIEPPAGDGWQMWEDTSEGSPISPVFATPEELARWLADTNASAFGNQGATYEHWLGMIRREGWAPAMVIENGRMMSGVEFSADRAKDEG